MSKPMATWAYALNLTKGGFVMDFKTLVECTVTDLEVKLQHANNLLNRQCANLVSIHAYGYIHGITYTDLRGIAHALPVSELDELIAYYWETLQEITTNEAAILVTLNYLELDLI